MSGSMRREVREWKQKINPFNKCGVKAHATLGIMARPGDYQTLQAARCAHGVGRAAPQGMLGFAVAVL